MDDFKDTASYKLLKEQVAIQHGYSLSDDDPILIFVTLNDYLLKQYKEMFDNTLEDLSDVVFNTKTDINNYIKENEIVLFRRIQEINNKNVENVHNEIRNHFKQEAEAYIKLNNSANSNNTFLKMAILINITISIIIAVIMIMK